MPTLVFPSISATHKVPGVYSLNKFGVGSSGSGLANSRILVTGHKLAAGTLTANTGLVQVFSREEAIGYVGEFSEAYYQAVAGLSTGADVWLCPVAEPGGATAATLTVTFTGTWTGTGELQLELDGEIVSVSVGATLTTAAANTAANVNGKGLWCTAGSSAGVATLTTRNKGIRQNQHKAKIINVSLPSGCTVTLAGGTAVSGVTPFSGATGTDDASGVITTIKSKEFAIIAAAQADATNAQLFEDHVVSEMDPTIGHLEQVVFATDASLATATTLAQTTLNTVQAQLLWARNSKVHPSVLAALFGGKRAVAESVNPNQRYAAVFNDAPCLLSSIRLEGLDSPLPSEISAALNAGITPVANVDGAMQVVKSVTTRSLNGSAADYNTDTTNKVTVPFRLRKMSEAAAAEYARANPYSSDDPPEGDDAPPEGVGFPRLYTGVLRGVQQQAVKNGWLDSNKVAEQPANAWWNATAKQTEAIVPAPVQEHTYKILNQINQVAF